MDRYAGLHLLFALWSGCSCQGACCRYKAPQPENHNSGSRTDHRRLRPCHFLLQERPALSTGEYRKSHRIAMRAFRSRQAGSRRGFRNMSLWNLFLYRRGMAAEARNCTSLPSTSIVFVTAILCLLTHRCLPKHSAHIQRCTMRRKQRLLCSCRF